MPLFGSKREANPPPQTITTTTTHKASPTRSSGLFSRRKSSSLSPDGRASTTTHSSHHTGTTTSPNRHSSILSKNSGGGGLLHRNHEDPSISAARERVMSAENAEKEADRALVAARTAVRDARAEVKRLEHEAAEEARLAKIKQGQAASLSKRGNLLGRHG